MRLEVTFSSFYFKKFPNYSKFSQLVYKKRLIPWWWKHQQTFSFFKKNTFKDSISLLKDLKLLSLLFEMIASKVDSL